jgi:hypothetical protein
MAGRNSDNNPKKIIRIGTLRPFLRPWRNIVDNPAFPGSAGHSSEKHRELEATDERTRCTADSAVLHQANHGPRFGCAAMEAAKGKINAMQRSVTYNAGTE